MDFKFLLAIYFYFLLISTNILAQKSIPFRIGPFEKSQYNDCINKGHSRCWLDTFEYSGLSGELNLITARALGKYRESGNRGVGLGFGISLAYQPINRFPLTIHSDIGFLYTDIQNRDAFVPVIPVNGNNDIVPFPVKLNIKNELFLGNIGFRYWFPTRYWQPYAMAGIGFINHNTLLRLYDDDQWPLLGTSNEGLLLESRVKHNWYGSRFVATGISWNAAYSLNLDFRFTLIYSQKFSYQSLKLPEEWNLHFAQTQSNVNPSDLVGEENDMFNKQQSVPFYMLMFNFSLTAFFE